MPTPHSTENYSIGKGILYIGEWSGTTPPTDPSGYAEIGNCPSIEIEPTIERLPHYSSRSGFRTKDKNPVIQQEYMVNFECDEIATQNLSYWMQGTKTANVVAGLTAVDQEFALKFISDNPIGPNGTWRFWRVTLSPNGAMQLIGEEWMVQAYAAEGLADVANNPTEPYFTYTAVTTTTTTTTT